MNQIAHLGMGTKRVCKSCGAKYYDLDQQPPACPKCHAEFVAVVRLVSVPRAAKMKTGIRFGRNMPASPVHHDPVLEEPRIADGNSAGTDDDDEEDDEESELPDDEERKDDQDDEEADGDEEEPRDADG